MRSYPKQFHVLSMLMALSFIETVSILLPAGAVHSKLGVAPLACSADIQFLWFQKPTSKMTMTFGFVFSTWGKKQKSLTQKDSIQRVVHLSLFFAPFLEHTWFLAFLVFEPTNEGFVKRCWSLGASETNYVFSKWPC